MTDEAGDQTTPPQTAQVLPLRLRRLTTDAVGITSNADNVTTWANQRTITQRKLF